MVQSPRRASTAAGRIMSRTMVYTASPFATEIAFAHAVQVGRHSHREQRCEAFAMIIVSFSNAILGRVDEFHQAKGLRRS